MKTQATAPQVINLEAALPTFDEGMRQMLDTILGPENRASRHLAAYALEMAETIVDAEARRALGLVGLKAASRVAVPPVYQEALEKHACSWTLDLPEPEELDRSSRA